MAKEEGFEPARDLRPHTPRTKAEEEGFEPSVRLLVHSLSRTARSTTPALLQYVTGYSKINSSAIVVYV